MSNRLWSIVDIVALLLIPASFVAAWRWEWFHDYASREPVRIWLMDIVLLVVFAVALGLSKDRGILGILVDEGNRVSLSRLQIAIWSVILLAGIAAALTVNLGRGCQLPPEGTVPPAGSCAQSPFDIDLPDELLILAGISAATFGGAAVLNSQNRNRVPAGAIWEGGSFRRVDPIAERMYRDGYVPLGITAAKPLPSKATLGDLVRGDLQSDYVSLDLSRIQQLVLIIVLAAAYAVTFGQGLNQDAAQPIAFADFDSSLNVLLAISGVTYLGVKALKSAAIR